MTRPRPRCPDVPDVHPADQPKVEAKKRPPVAPFKETTPAECLEVHLAAGGYGKAQYDGVTNDELYDMYTLRPE